MCVLIVVVACLGKFGGTFVAARLSGLPSRDSASLGALMNTRGLMELVVLNLGPRPGRDLADAVRDDGADGDRHHLHDLAPAELVSGVRAHQASVGFLPRASRGSVAPDNTRRPSACGSSARVTAGQSRWQRGR